MDRNDRDRLDAVDASGKGPKTNDPIHHDNHPDVGDHVGEAAGGITGVLAGAAIGSAGGPIGTIIGGIAGAVGGWWSGRAISEAATKFTHSDDDYYRSHYESSSARLADRKYEDVRPAYQLGHIASQNPDYANRDFDAIEPDLQRGWSDDLRTRHGEWAQVRPYARDAYSRGRLGAAAAGVGAAAAGVGHKIADKVDDLKDRVDANPASRPGVDATDSARRAGGSFGSDAGMRASGTPGHESLGEKLGDKVDDLKDRVDGNPASRPGVDRTDDPDRRF